MGEALLHEALDGPFADFEISHQVLFGKVFHVHYGDNNTGKKKNERGGLTKGKIRRIYEYR